MRARIQLRYSVAFKQQVVSDLEDGRFGSIEAAREHYDIGGKGTVRRWLGKYGRNYLIPKVVRVEKPGEADQIRQLRGQVEQLQKALGQTQLEKILEESYLREACRALGTDVEVFKKKAVTTPSTERSRDPKQA